MGNKATFPLNRFQGYAKLMRVTGNKVTFPINRLQGKTAQQTRDSIEYRP